MKLFSVLAIVVGIVVRVDYAVAAPMGVIVVASGPRLALPMPNPPVNDDLRPYRFAPEFVRPHGKMPEGEFSAWADLMMPGPQINVHPQLEPPNPKDCSRKAALAHSFHYAMNKLRAIFGLPVIHHHHNVELQRVTQVDNNRPQVIEEVHASFESFFARFERAMRSLSLHESWALTLVLGCGLGSLLRMLVVLVVVFFRGRRGRRGCSRARCCRRRHAELPAPEPVEATPPSYTDKVTAQPEKPGTIELPAVTGMLAKASEDDLQEIVTLEQNEMLMVHWKHIDGTERVTPASDIHKLYPEKLFKFYESNLRWREVDE